MYSVVSANSQGLQLQLGPFNGSVSHIQSFKGLTHEIHNGIKVPFWDCRLQMEFGMIFYLFAGLWEWGMGAKKIPPHLCFISPLPPPPPPHSSKGESEGSKAIFK